MPRKEHHYFVYVLASISGTLYIGVTSALACRVNEHRVGARNGFTKKYGVHRLIYWEEFSQIRDAIAREKQLKGWRRERKIALFEQTNPSWRDLSRDFYKTIQMNRGPSTRA